jgi:fructose-bisphosphate aldolase, class II
MLVNLEQILKYAEEKKCALAAINAPTLEMAIATIEAAEELNTPIIIMHAQIHEDLGYIKIEQIAPVLKALAISSKVPVCMHLDHGESKAYVYKAIDLGFTSVMFDASSQSLEENIVQTKEIVSYAHMRNVSVEAELGSIPNNRGESGDGSIPEAKDYYTKPEEAIVFIERTGIDALAVSYGSVHGVYLSEPQLEISIVEKIRAKTKVPLVLHGASGLSIEDFHNSIDAGIRKINYFTSMSFEGSRAAKKALMENDQDMHFQKLAVIATQAMKEDVKRVIRIFSKLV